MPTREPTRLGVVVPSTNTTVERELGLLTPDDADWFVTRVLQTETEDPARKIATVLAMQHEVDAAVERLVGLGPDALGFACTAASFLSGAASDIDMCRRIDEQTGVPFFTASRAVAEGLRAVGAQRIALVTPYIDEVNQREVEYFAEVGIEVTAASGLGIVGNLPKGRLPLAASAEAVRSLDLHGADAVFISCTNWLTLGNIASLEEEFDLPVVSSNSALAWAMLTTSGLAAPAALGRLAGVQP